MMCLLTWVTGLSNGAFTDLSSVLRTVPGTVQTDTAAEPAEFFPPRSLLTAQWHPLQEDPPSAAGPVQDSLHWAWGWTPFCDGAGSLGAQKTQVNTDSDVTLRCPIRSLLDSPGVGGCRLHAVAAAVSSCLTSERDRPVSLCRSGQETHKTSLTDFSWAGKVGTITTAIYIKTRYIEYRMVVTKCVF